MYVCLWVQCMCLQVWYYTHMHILHIYLCIYLSPGKSLMWVTMVPLYLLFLEHHCSDYRVVFWRMCSIRFMKILRNCSCVSNRKCCMVGTSSCCQWNFIGAFFFLCQSSLLTKASWCQAEIWLQGFKIVCPDSHAFQILLTRKLLCVMCKHLSLQFIL